MRTLKNFLDKKEPSNYKEIAKKIMDEYKATLPEPAHNADSDISGSMTISDELTDTLKANLVGFGPTYSGAKVQDIVKARLVTWQAGGTGISPQTFIKLSEQARTLKYQTEIPKDHAYTNTAIPASHLLDQFLRHSDYYADLPDSDIKAFISGNFIQLGVATELVSMLSNIWLNFCFNSANAIAISGITLDKTNPMGPGSTELVALKNLLPKNNTDSESQKHGVLQSTVPALKILGLIDFINDINVTPKTIADADLHYYLHGISEIPEQLYVTFTGIWGHLEVLDRCLSTNPNNAVELSLSVLKVIEHMHDVLNAIVNRTRTLLSGRIENISEDVIMGTRDIGLSNIVAVLDSIAIKAAANQKYSVEELEAMLSMDGDEDKSSDGTLTVNALAELLEDVRTAMMVERFAHIYIAERIPDVNNRLRKMREDSSLPEGSAFSKDFFKALPVRITDKGLAAYIEDRSYDFGGNFGSSTFHQFSVLSLLNKHDDAGETSSTDLLSSYAINTDKPEQDEVITRLKGKLISLRDEMRQDFSKNKTANSVPTFKDLGNPAFAKQEDIKAAKKEIEKLKKSMNNHLVPISKKTEAKCEQLIADLEIDIAAAENAMGLQNTVDTRQDAMDSNNTNSRIDGVDCIPGTDKVYCYLKQEFVIPHAVEFFDINDETVNYDATITGAAAKSDDSQSVYDDFDEHLNKLKEQTTRMKMASMLGSNTELDPKELILEAKAALAIASDMLTGPSGVIMNQVLGEAIVNAISTIITDTREVIGIAESTGVPVNTLKQAVSKITAVFMDTTGKMADLKEKSFALNRVVYNLECFVFAANNAVDESGEFNVHEYKAIDDAHEKLEVLGLSAKDGYFDTSKDIDAIIDNVRMLIVKIRASINEDNIEESQILIADMKDVSTAIKEHYFAIQAAASSRYFDNQDQFFGGRDQLLDIDRESPETNSSFPDNTDEDFEGKDVVFDADVDASMSVTNAKDSLTCFIWAVELASKDGVFDINNYQGVDHASDQIPFNTMMSDDDISEDDEVRDLVRSYLRIVHSLATPRDEKSASDRSPTCEEIYIRDATAALTACRVLVSDRASAHSKSFSDIHMTIRADRPTDLFSISGDKIDSGSAEMKPHLAISPLEVPVDLSRERNLLVSELPTSLLMDIDIDLDLGFDDDPFLDFDEELLEFDEPLDSDFDDGSDFDQTVAGELRRLLAVEAATNTTEGDM